MRMKIAITHWVLLQENKNCDRFFCALKTPMWVKRYVRFEALIEAHEGAASNYNSNIRKTAQTRKLNFRAFVAASTLKYYTSVPSQIHETYEEDKYYAYCCFPRPTICILILSNSKTHSCYIHLYAKHHRQCFRAVCTSNGCADPQETSSAPYLNILPGKSINLAASSAAGRRPKQGFLARFVLLKNSRISDRRCHVPL